MRDCVLYVCYYYLKVISFSLCKFGSPRYSSFSIPQMKIICRLFPYYFFLPTGQALGLYLVEAVVVQPHHSATLYRYATTNLKLTWNRFYIVLNP